MVLGPRPQLVEGEIAHISPVSVVRAKARVRAGDNWGMTDLLFADRSERGKLRFSGPQSAWFLHQVLTQAFEDIAPGEARDAAMITAHGRMTAYIEAIATDDALLAHFEPELIDTFPESIRKYVFATQVEIDDVTGEMGLVLVAGDSWREAGEGIDETAVLHPTSSLGAPAGYVWLPRAAIGSALAQLEELGARRASEGELEEIRIRNRVARWGREMDSKTFPQEAEVDARAVHYEKGCYLGQEAMAKIHFRGKVNRRLALLEGASLEPGIDVESGGERVGKVTSVSDGRALALVRYTVEPGAEVQAGGSPAVVVG